LGDGFNTDDTFVVRRSSVRRSSVRRSWFVVASFVVASFLPVLAQTEFAARSAAPVTFLQINDVYTTLPVDGQGGLARVATLKQNLANAGRTPFLVIAGDFLSPSVASSVFKGEHMIAALNATGLDLATLGNHEFDFGDDVDSADARGDLSMVVSNVVDTATAADRRRRAPVIKTSARWKVGLMAPPQHTGDHRRQKQHTHRGSAAAAGQHLPLLKQAGRPSSAVRTSRSPTIGRWWRYPEIDLVIGEHYHHRDREPLADQQVGIGRKARRAHRHEPPAGRNGRAFLRTSADHERAAR
jgi:2',3'-cyclic-nucleotide 2'-phosphodiesterase (5'-nucleotidase family)